MRKNILIVATIILMFLLTSCSSVDNSKNTPVVLKVQPKVEKVGEKSEVFQKGHGSWYGKDFHGKETSSGEKFNMNDMTAAHKQLPFGTLVEVTNLDNGKKVVVRINDRGPFSKKRVIDLSKTAFSKISDTEVGVIPLEIRVLNKPEKKS